MMLARYWNPLIPLSLLHAPGSMVAINAHTMPISNGWHDQEIDSIRIIGQRESPRSAGRQS